MTLPRFSANRVRKGESPELVSSRNFEGLARITDAHAKEIESVSSLLAETVRTVRSLSRRAAIPHSVKYSLNYTDFNTAGAVLQANSTFVTLPAGVKCSSILLYPTAAWTGGSIASVALSAGFASGIALEPFLTSVPFGHNPIPFVPSMTGTTALYVQAVSDGGYLNELTSGAVDIYLEISQFANY